MNLFVANLKIDDEEEREKICFDFRMLSNMSKQGKAKFQNRTQIIEPARDDLFWLKNDLSDCFPSFGFQLEPANRQRQEN